MTIYFCGFCGASHGGGEDWKAHLRAAHSSLYHCPECGTIFLRWGYLGLPGSGYEIVSRGGNSEKVPGPYCSINPPMYVPCAGERLCPACAAKFQEELMLSHPRKYTYIGDGKFRSSMGLVSPAWAVSWRYAEVSPEEVGLEEGQVWLVAVDNHHGLRIEPTLYPIRPADE